MLMIVYNQLVNNPVISELAGNRIKFYEVPETMETPFVVIRPLDVPTPSLYASDKELSSKFTYQIEVETSIRMDAKKIQAAIKKEMAELGFGQLNEGLDNYFDATKHYVDARRYRANTKLYDTNY